MLDGKRILLIISGGIAAYKALDLIRRLRERGAAVTPVLTRAAEQFVTPLSVSALAGQKVFRDLFDLTDEAEMGHIQLSRSADLIVVAPATADLIAKMAQGRADDLASTLLLATDTPVLLAPAMNVRMWDQAATRRNIALVQSDGARLVGPNEGDMACGEFGPGRMSEPMEILQDIERHFAKGPLSDKHIIVTSGPTHEPIDPVRYIANRSSGTQGVAIASALLARGAKVTFVTGPAKTPNPAGCDVKTVETARQMADAVEAALPADAAICVAAVADWYVENASASKLKKTANGMPDLIFAENPDILATIAQRSSDRPALVIGFAAETDNIIENAKSKRARKGCDWIVANDVSKETGIMGGEENAVTLVTAATAETWPRMHKTAVADKLADKIVQAFGGK